MDIRENLRWKIKKKKMENWGGGEMEKEKLARVETGKKEIGKKRMLGKEKIRKIEICETGKRKIMYSKGEQEK